MKRSLFTIVLSLALMGVVNWPTGILAKPYIPKLDTEVLEQLPMPVDGGMKKLRQWQKKLTQEPHNLTLAVRLARQYVELGHSQADPRYNGYAQAALRPWWNAAPPPPEVLLLRATLQQRRHKFHEALTDLHRALQLQPGNGQAWLTKAIIHQVRGEYDEARRGCLQLLRWSNTLVTTICICSITSLSGQAEQSYRALQQARQRHPGADRDQLWALTLLAEMAARLGNLSAAEEHFKDALSLGLRDVYLLGAYSDFLLDQNRPADVQALLDNDIRPDGLLLRLALAERQLYGQQLNHYVDGLRARFAENRLRNDGRHLRDEARFTLHLLKNPKQALVLAQQNWAVQREPWDARILLEAALQAHDPASAQPVLEWLKDAGLEDVQLQRFTTHFNTSLS